MGKSTSELKNRIELWGIVKVESKLGDTTDEKRITKLWSKINYYAGSVKSGQAETDYSDTKYKIKIRKSKRLIDNTNWLVYKTQKFEIKYVIPDYKDNSFLYLHCNAIKE